MKIRSLLKNKNSLEELVKRYFNEDIFRDMTINDVMTLFRSYSKSLYFYVKNKDQYDFMDSSSGYFLFRGVKNPRSNGMMLFWGADKYKDGNERKSLTGVNNRNNVLNQLPAWNKFPKRNRSALITTSSRHADYFGTTYLVIPNDNAKLACVPEGVEDFNNYNTFTHSRKLADVALDYSVIVNIQRLLREEANDFFEKKEDLDRYIETVKLINGQNFTLEQAKLIDKLIKQLDLSFPTIMRDSILIYTQHSLDIPYNSYVEMIEDVYDPDQAGFEIINVTDLGPKYFNREMWTEDPIALVPIYAAAALLDLAEQVYKNK